MIDSDVRTDIEILEEIENVPHCETGHSIPTVRRWAGDCTHTVVAYFDIKCNGKRGGVCLNTVIGAQGEMAKGYVCHDCGKPLSECWVITPV